MSDSDTDPHLDDIAVRDTWVSDAIYKPVQAMILDILSEGP
ncbi:putative transcriptional regulator [Halogeometricum pallidum JCM 14848]|uniref:Putative transcriptional regulator n=1 Tax=Halogeometricum pallidum JCM 14848 TaxID=1227487 RepID=M0DD20_HALPD|nr:putative transcriptional regulator [Halogeometricum pallidum JCM 14848]